MKPDRVGFRPNFWGRSPAIRQQAEEYLNKIESDAAPALRRLSHQWPLEPGSSAWLALIFLIAIHLWRNPSGQDRFLQIQEEILARQLPEYSSRWTDEQVEDFLARVTSDGFRADTMLGDLPKAASVLGSMHWTLIKFDEHLLATSDQPVTVVPLLKPGFQALVVAHPRGPMIDCEEIRFAVGPRHALLFTWRDEPSASTAIEGSDEIAAQLNRAVIAQADREWFHHPARRPTRLTPPILEAGRCVPIGRIVHPDYTWETALTSRRRAETAISVERMVEDDVDGEVRVVRIGPRAA